MCEVELLSAITKAACYEREGYVRLSKRRIPSSISMYLRQVCVHLILRVIMPAVTVGMGTLE